MGAYACIGVRIICVYMRVYGFICVYMREYVHLHVRVYECICVYMRVNVHICVYMRVYACICMYACRHGDPGRAGGYTVTDCDGLPRILEWGG